MVHIRIRGARGNQCPDAQHPRILVPDVAEDVPVDGDVDLVRESCEPTPESVRALAFRLREEAQLANHLRPRRDWKGGEYPAGLTFNLNVIPHVV